MAGMKTVTYRLSKQQRAARLEGELTYTYVGPTDQGHDPDHDQFVAELQKLCSQHGIRLTVEEPAS